MSHIVYDYDQDTRNITFEVIYEYVEGRVEDGRWYPNTIDVHAVHVLLVDYFSPDGEKIASIRGCDMQEDALKALESEVSIKVGVEIVKYDYFFDHLVSNA